MEWGVQYDVVPAFGESEGASIDGGKLVEGYELGGVVKMVEEGMGEINSAVLFFEGGGVRIV